MNSREIKFYKEVGEQPINVLQRESSRVEEVTSFGLHSSRPKPVTIFYQEGKQRVIGQAAQLSASKLIVKGQPFFLTQVIK